MRNNATSTGAAKTSASYKASTGEARTAGETPSTSLTAFTSTAPLTADVDIGNLHDDLKICIN